MARPEDFPALTALLVENNQVIDGIAYREFSFPTVVAVKNGEIIGFASALVGTPYAVITEMAVSRAHQRKGYGPRLLQALELLIQAAGCPAWLCVTQEKNTLVTDWLERYGAQPLDAVGTVYVRRF